MMPSSGCGFSYATSQGMYERLFLKDGNGVRSIVVDGSVEEKIFSADISNLKFRVNTLEIYIRSEGYDIASQFMGIAGNGLDVGLVFDYQTESVKNQTIPITNNDELRLVSNISNFNTLSNDFIFRGTLNFGLGGLLLDHEQGDYFSLLINDDLSDLISFFVYVDGFIV